MKYLVYCILRNCARARSNPGAGLDGRPIRFVTQDGIGAAYSEVDEPFPASDASQAMAYARVVEALHQTGAVLPMRYGRLFQDREQVAQFLQRQSTDLRACLEEIEGCEEMGVRVLLREPARPAPSVRHEESRPLSVPREGPGHGTTPATGADYLGSRRAIYAERDRAREEAPVVEASILHSLDGLFLKSRVERPSAGNKALLSLYFLIRSDGVGAFRVAFQRLRAQSDRALLLTGPWPPYNFVSFEST